MSPYWRGQLDLAIPIKVWDKIPAARKIAFRDEVRALKALAVKINEGQDNEEMTVLANWHVCHHDTGEPCDSVQEI